MKFSIFNPTKPLQQIDGSDTIPANNSTRTLVLCFDSTGGSFGSKNSNVIQFVSLLAKDDQTQQMVYYHTGIGTFTYIPLLNPLKARLLMILDSMFAWQLKTHIMDVIPLSDTAGDKICLFGFSRGAYTVRALAGMLNKVGLLSAGNYREIPFAYAMYADTSQIGWEQSSAFKRTFCRSVDIDFVGIWDTVSSVGFFATELPFCSFNPSIKVLRHAIALDEHRVAFDVDCFVSSEAEYHRGDLQRAGIQERPGSKLGTNCLEIWFAGSHTDVGGGGGVAADSLSRSSLRWMIRQCFLANTGIRFHSERLREVGLNPATLYPLVLDFPNSDLNSSSVPSQSPLGEHSPTSQANIDDTFLFDTEADEDIASALQLVRDDLWSTPIWWLLELLPRPFISKQFWDIPIILFRRPHFGRPREILRQTGTYFHRTVALKMELTSKTSKPYRPRAIASETPRFLE